MLGLILSKDRKMNAIFVKCRDVPKDLISLLLLVTPETVEDPSEERQVNVSWKRGWSDRWSPMPGESMGHSGCS